MTGLSGITTIGHLCSANKFLSVSLNPALVSIEVPNLETIGSHIWVENNSSLQVLKLAKLIAIGNQCHVVENPMLPTCYVTAIETQISTNCEKTGNDDNGTCN